MWSLEGVGVRAADVKKERTQKLENKKKTKAEIL